MKKEDEDLQHYMACMRSYHSTPYSIRLPGLASDVNLRFEYLRAIPEHVMIVSAMTFDQIKNLESTDCLDLQQMEPQ